MTILSKLRRMLHRKSVEYCAPLAAGNTAAGSFVVSDKSTIIPTHDTAYYVGGVNVIWNYNADQDGWVQIPGSGVAGTFAAGSCGEFRALGAPGGSFTTTAAGGTTSQINTGLTLTRDLSGCEIRVISGTGVGYSGTIKNNGLGANSSIYLNTPNGVAFDATTVFQMYSGSLWFFNAGTTAVGFTVYDRATNAWTARSVTGLPTAWGTDAQLVSTPGRTSNGGNGFVNGTAAAGAASTISTGKAFVVDQWKNFQVRIKSGTGAGQIRRISSNTSGGVVTVSSAWTVVPDATSVFVIEGDDYYFYLLGNNSVNTYRYDASTNTWSTLAPTAARGGAPGAGVTADWIDRVLSTEWTDGSYGFHYSNTIYHQNGRYIFSFRGAGGSVLDVYDIAANTWISGVAYGQQMETFSTGSCSVDLDGIIYINKDATGRIFRFDVAKNVLEPCFFNPVPQGTAIAGDKMFMTNYSDGSGDDLDFLYMLANTRTELCRCVIF